MTRLHVKQNENKKQNQSVSQVCSHCGDEPALPGDSYGRSCRRAAWKNSRARRRAFARELAARLTKSPEETTKRAEEHEQENGARRD